MTVLSTNEITYVARKRLLKQNLLIVLSFILAHNQLYDTSSVVPEQGLKKGAH